MHVLEGVGWSSHVGMGVTGIPAVELTAYCQGTATELGPVDFEDVLLASRAFSHGINEYSGKVIEPPWAPELTSEQEEEHRKNVEAMFDRAMGVV